MKFNPKSERIISTDPGSFIKAGIRNYENKMADSSDEFFSDYASSSYPDYVLNMNQMQLLCQV